MVERAILLAAGRGSRLGALTASTPKPLLEIGGVPIVVRAISGLASAGIREVLVVTGYAADTLESALKAASLPVSVEFVRQHTPEGTACAALLGRDFAGDERCFLGWADILVDDCAYRPVVSSFPEADAVLAVNEVDDPWTGAAVYVTDDSRVTSIVEKPPRGTSTTTWNNAGLVVLRPTAWPFIESVEPSERGEFELTTALANMVADSRDVRAVPLTGAWFDIGTPQDLARARAGFRGSE